jgi:hypothetical protein
MLRPTGVLRKPEPPPGQMRGISSVYGDFSLFFAFSK